MLTKLRTYLDSWRFILVFGLIYFTSQGIIAVIVHPLGPEMLVVQTTLSADHVREIFARWDAAGLLDTYARHYYLDNIHPLWYALFLAAMLAKGFNANAVTKQLNALLLLPFIAGSFDVLENVIHQSFLADRANITQTPVFVSNGAALAKWLLALVCVLSVVGLILRAKLRGRSKSAAD